MDGVGGARKVKLQRLGVLLFGEIVEHCACLKKINRLQGRQKETHPRVEHHVQADAALPQLQGFDDDVDVVVPHQRHHGLERVDEHAPHARLRSQSCLAIAPVRCRVVILAYMLTATRLMLASREKTQQHRTDLRLASAV